MKNLAIIAVIAILWDVSLFAQGCPPGNLVLNSQSDVDNFSINYPDCHVISGDVLIGFDTLYSSNISNLAALSQINSITGSLHIEANPLLSSLQGLENLASVGQELYIGWNAGLQNLAGLNGITTIGGSLRVEENLVLAKFNSFDNLVEVQGIYIQHNIKLKNLNGFHALKSADGIWIYYNPVMTQIDAFDNLESIGHSNLYVLFNLNLAAFDAFQRLKIVRSNIDIEGNNLLTSLHGLDSLKMVTPFGIRILQNPMLTNLEGLGSLDSMGSGLMVAQNNGLVSLEGLGALKPNTSITISNNPLLPNLKGLSKVSILRSLELYGNNALTDLSGLDSLTEITANFFVYGHSSITSFKGLEKIQKINNLVVDGNPILTSFGDHFPNLKFVQNITIRGNPKLSDLNGLQNIEEIESMGFVANPLLSDFSRLPNLDSLQFLYLRECPLLMDLDDFQNLSLLKELYLIQNAALSDLSNLQNLYKLESVVIKDNPLLSNCSVYPICNFILNSSNNITIENNSPGCNSIMEVEEGCGAVPVRVAVMIDNNGDCEPDSTDTPLENILVSLSGGIQMNLRPTTIDGWASFGFLDTGSFKLDLPNFPTNKWQMCQDSFVVSLDPGTDSITRYFLLQPTGVLCPELSVELGLPPFFRGCLVQTPINVTVINAGTATAEGVTVAVVMPPLLELLSSVPPLAGQNGDTLFFDIGSMSPFAVQTVGMVVKTNCDSLLIGESLCLEAFAGLDNPCTSDSAQFSEIRLFSQCVADTLVRFTIKNVRNAPTQNQHEYVILEDEIIMFTSNFALGAFGSMNVDVPSDGSTYRMEATKYDNGEMTATVRENCGGFTPGFVTAYWFDRSLRNYDFDCRAINLAYDPNQKTAIPTGIGSDHIIVANGPIAYTIEFQNTGTDTAFRVLLRDVLPQQVDVATFRPGFASHPYTWEIKDGKLEVLFSPIALPDSNVNEQASHGFFSFTIDQKPDLSDGTILENTASIIFDFNPAIVTNTVVHTIGKLLVSQDEPQRFPNLWRVFGNPTRTSATFHAIGQITGNKRFELRDVMGRNVQTAQFSEDSFEFQRGALSTGLYFFSITDAQGRVFTGRIVVVD